MNGIDANYRSTLGRLEVYRDLSDRMEVVEKRVGTLYDVGDRMAERIEAVEHEVGVAKAEWGEVLGRLAEVERLYEVEGKTRQGDIYATHRAISQDMDSREESFHSELRRVADRVAALEATAEKSRGISNKRIDWANDLHDKLSTRVAEIDKRLSTTTHDLDLWCEENIERIDNRLTALEATVDAHNAARAWPKEFEGTHSRDRDATCEPSLPTATEDESRALRELADWASDHRMRDRAIGIATRNARLGGRRELATEIAERLRSGKEYRPALAYTGDALVIADWIEREFCGEEGEDEG